MEWGWGGVGGGREGGGLGRGAFVRRPGGGGGGGRLVCCKRSGFFSTRAGPGRRRSRTSWVYVTPEVVQRGILDEKPSLHESTWLFTHPCTHMPKYRRTREMNRVDGILGGPIGTSM